MLSSTVPLQSQLEPYVAEYYRSTKKPAILQKSRLWLRKLLERERKRVVAQELHEQLRGDDLRILLTAIRKIP